MTSLLALYDALSPILIAGAFLAGISIGQRRAGDAIRKRQAPNTISRNFASPGMPYAGIIEAEVICSRRLH